MLRPTVMDHKEEIRHLPIHVKGFVLIDLVRSCRREDEEVVAKRDPGRLGCFDRQSRSSSASPSFDIGDEAVKVRVPPETERSADRT